MFDVQSSSFVRLVVKLTFSSTPWHVLMKRFWLSSWHYLWPIHLRPHYQASLTCVLSTFPSRQPQQQTLVCRRTLQRHRCLRCRCSSTRPASKVEHKFKVTRVQQGRGSSTVSVVPIPSNQRRNGKSGKKKLKQTLGLLVSNISVILDTPDKFVTFYKLFLNFLISSLSWICKEIFYLSLDLQSAVSPVSRIFFALADNSLLF